MPSPVRIDINTSIRGTFFLKNILLR